MKLSPKDVGKKTLIKKISLPGAMAVGVTALITVDKAMFKWEKYKKMYIGTLTLEIRFPGRVEDIILFKEKHTRFSVVSNSLEKAIQEIS